ncbi:hypothetical protein SEA_YEET_58 [Mycobacterium phage Yeet]|nr:hypothetical protein SEA_YEET_58 [Mycobacterium phage Yeet]
MTTGGDEPEWDEWGEPLNDAAWDLNEKYEAVAALTCPYYWNRKIDNPMCVSGCWEEPICHTNGPFEFPPDWPAERCLATAVNTHVQFHFNRPNLPNLFRKA